MPSQLDNKRSKHRYRLIIIPLISIVTLLCLFNGFMGIFALQEKASEREEKYEWVVTSQTLPPKGKAKKRSILLIHGFGGSPYDYKPLAAHLSRKGFRVVIPVLPGQTRSTLAYKRGSYTSDFYMEYLLNLVNEETQHFGIKPYLCGFSMGGALATIIASKGVVERLILVAPFYSLPRMNDLIGYLSRGLKYFVPIVPKVSKGQINDPHGYRKFTPGSAIISLGAFCELQKTALEAQNSINKIPPIPILVLVSPNDKVASFSHMEKMLSPLENVRILEYPRSNHILLYDYDSDEIISEIIRFFES